MSRTYRREEVFLKGEKGPVYAGDTVSSGTLSITGTSTYEFRDSDDTLLSSGNVTGQDTSGATVRAWVNVNTNTFGAGGTALKRGDYWLEIIFTVDASGDDIERFERERFKIRVD